MFNKNFISIIGFFTINLYNFILCILNNFFKKIFKIMRIKKYKKYSPRVLPTECIRRHLTESGDLSDEYTNEIILSTFHSSLVHISQSPTSCRRNKSVGISQSPTHLSMKIVCRYCIHSPTE
jgi:hypothetical protein